MGGGRQGGLHSVAFVVRPEDVLVQENDAMVPTDQGDFAANLAGDWMFPRVASEEVLVRKPPKIINGYLFGDLLGEGSYGKVKECLHQETLIRYAVKIFKHNRIKKIPNGFANVDREIRLLRRLKHLNLVNMIDVFWVPKKEKWYMVLDYCVCSLQEMLDSVDTKRLPLFQAHAYFVQLIDGLEYLHGQRVIHKDIKPGNLLLSSSECLKISDLGVAEDGHHFQDIVWCQSGQGTPKFQPPEIAAGKDEKFLGEPVDIWASGVTLYNLLSGEYPFDGSALLPLYNDIATRELSMPTSVRLEEDACHLLHAMMLKDPVKRITIREIRKTDWWRRKHSCFEEKVNIPVKNGDPQRSLTVYPYLEQLYAGELSMCDSTSGTERPHSSTSATNREKSGDPPNRPQHSSAGKRTPSNLNGNLKEETPGGAAALSDNMCRSTSSRASNKAGTRCQFRKMRSEK